jgi:hypothetical protein
MIEGFRKLTPEQVIEFATIYPYVEPAGDGEHCLDMGMEIYSCARLPGHPGTMHMSYHTATYAGVVSSHTFVPLYQWFS